jgi:hypothetical protein
VCVPHKLNTNVSYALLQGLLLMLLLLLSPHLR